MLDLQKHSLCLLEGESPLTLHTHTLTPSHIHRPTATTSTGRGVMSISGLSYGVVRVEEPGSITSLTLQDVGMVMPGGKLMVCLQLHDVIV